LIYECGADSGGAIYAVSGTHSISNCRLHANSAFEGGAVAIVGGSTHIEKSLIIGDGATYGGGGVHVENASASIVQCTITDNGSQSGAAGLIALNATVDLRQTILRFSCGFPWDVPPFDLASTAGSTIQVECCNIDPAMAVEDGGTITWGSGNMTQAPSFCHPMQCQGNWHERNFGVTMDSPCLPENNSCGLLIGALSWGCTTTSIEPRSWGSIKAAYRE
jgi:hypothetical protein